MSGILFVNTFLSYLMLLLVIVVVGAIAFLIGTNARKAKNAKEIPQNTEHADQV